MTDEHFKKFRKMKSMLPAGAVRQKMRAEGYSAADIDDFLDGKVNTLPPPAAVTAAASSSSSSSAGNGAAATGGGLRPPPPAPPGNPLAGLGAVKLRSANESAAIRPAAPKPLSLLDQIQQGPKLKAVVKEEDPRPEQPKSLQGSGGLLGMLAVAMSDRRFNMKENESDDDSDSSGFSDSDSDFD